MNSTIKQVVLSIVLLQTAYSQAFAEFVTPDELAVSGQDVIKTVVTAPEAIAPVAKGYLEIAREGMNSVLAYRPSMPSMPSISMPKVSLPTMPKISMPTMPSFSMPKLSMPSMPSMPSISMPKVSMPSIPESVVAKYESAKTFVAPYATSVKEAVVPHVTAKNGAIAAGTVVVAAGLYAGYKKYGMPSMPKFSNKLGFAAKKAEDKSVVKADLKKQVLNAILTGNEQGALSLVQDNQALAAMVRGYFVARNANWDARKIAQRLNAIEIELDKLA